MMKVATVMTMTLSFLCATFAVPPNNIGDARYPTIEGLVVLAPGTNDKNACKPSDGYVGGGFYVQDQNGNGIWVCPADIALVSGVNKGDDVKVTGLIQNSNVHVLTVTASSIDVQPGQAVQSEVVKAGDYDLFQNGLEYGDLISYEGFVELLWDEDVGAGLSITDCDGNSIKGWWTHQDGVDLYALFDLPQGEHDASNWQYSYYQMVGFYDVYDPYCFSWGGSEFQPRYGDITKLEPNPCS